MGNFEANHDHSRMGLRVSSVVERETPGTSCWLSILNEVRSLPRTDQSWVTRPWLIPSVEFLGGAEQNQFYSLVELVHSVNLVPMANRWTWKLESTGDFSVASAHRQIDELRLPNIGAETRWVKCVPIKINFLAWKIRNDALPTRFNISRRGIDIQDMPCPICDNAIESSEHLFFRCSLIRDIGKKIVRWWNMEYEEMNSYDEWKTWIVSRRMGSKLKNMSEGVWYTLWWYVWNHRNKILFDETTPVKSMLLDNVISSSFHWCKSRSKTSFG
nr:RNA-directed DNA polymerase, eukaryota [Tanacetum cinerariifolium]